VGEIKAIRIKFFDNDFCSAALASLEALGWVLDLDNAPNDFILEEFKFLIHRLANIKKRSDKSGHSGVSKEYFDKCTIESLTYIPKEWDNSETVIYDFSEMNTYTI
jgi:hypothetical protein